MDKRILEMRRDLDEAHRVMQVQLVGMARLKNERNAAERLLEQAYKALGPVVSKLPEEGTENIAVKFAYAALEQHARKLQERRHG